MEKSPKIGAQIYGYAVCLVAVITFLVCVTGLVNAIIDLGDPLHAGYTAPGSPSLASYENYKLDVMKSFSQSGKGSSDSFIPDETALKSMFEAAKEDKITKVRHDSKKAILLSGLMIFIAGIMFITHWRWMQRIARN